MLGLIGVGGKRGVDIGDRIGHSARFRAAANAYLVRNTNAGSATKATLSFRVKRGQLGDNRLIRTDVGGTAVGIIFFDGNDKLNWFGRDNVPNTQMSLITSAVYRDPAAWLQIVMAADTSQAVTSDRLKIWVNGQQIVAFDTAIYPGLNQAVDLFGNGNDLYIGRNGADITRYFDGLVADVWIIDNQFLTASSFGRFSVDTGQWVPKSYTGAVGTNDIHLAFAGVATASDFGLDSSGNAHNFVVTNMSATAGITYDWLTDTATNNYPIWNLLNKDASALIYGGGMYVDTGTTGGGPTYGTAPVQHGVRTQFEIIGTGGMATASGRISIANTVFSKNVTYLSNGQKQVDGVNTSYGATYTDNDVISVEVDGVANTVTFYKNGTLQGAISYTLADGIDYFPHCADGSSGGGVLYELNGGQKPFTHALQAGFADMGSASLPPPPITNPKKCFDINLRAGTGAAFSITGKALQPDLVWTKNRTSGSDHALYDSVRGAQKEIAPDAAASETTQTQGITAFSAGGFSGGTRNQVNFSGGAFVDWLWKKGAAYGLDIVPVTGTGVARTVTHGLGVKPEMIISKPLSPAYNWTVYHKYAGASPEQNYLILNQSGGYNTASTIWNNTAPTPSVFSLGTSIGVNEAGSTFIYYLFASVPGFSSIGGFVANGSTDGVFVYCGFRPRYIMLKRVDATGDWVVFDTARDLANPVANALFPDLANAEASAVGLDTLSNGFKIRAAGGGTVNTSGAQMAYYAIAEAPFKYANAR